MTDGGRADGGMGGVTEFPTKKNNQATPLERVATREFDVYPQPPTHSSLPGTHILINRESLNAINPRRFHQVIGRHVDMYNR